jgi:hypothetical protein
MSINLAIEGDSDEGIALAILKTCGLRASGIYGRKGKDYLKKQAKSYNAAAKFLPWLILADLDDPTKCPGALAEEWLPNRERLLVFSLAVVEMESWILADRESTAEFLGVSKDKIPLAPDDIADPKQFLINLARKSRKRDIREGLVPREGSGASVGPTYVADIREYGLNDWHPEVAAASSPSLHRCLDRLRQLVNILQQ